MVNFIMKTNSQICQKLVSFFFSNLITTNLSAHRSVPLPRSNSSPHSNLRPQTYSYPHSYQRPCYSSLSDNETNHDLHLISSDLWEAITGEQLTPERICQLQEVSLVPGSSNVVQTPPQNLHYVMMSRDRTECRALQQQLQDGTPEERMIIFNSLFPKLNELIYDFSANYVIQKLCEVITPEQQSLVLDFFLQDINHVVEHPNGCRVLQKFIESTSVENIDTIYMALEPNLIPLCKSLNGNHIVQRFIESLPNHVDRIITLLKPHVVDLVVDNCGCRVVQKLFDLMPIDRLQPLVDEVLKDAANLAVNQYGNYVVQNILEAGKEYHIGELIKAFSGHFSKFSIHKFASNVIEKCIRGATPAQRQIIFDEVIGKEGHYEYVRIKKMAGDQFGNYVIQRIIEFGSESQQNAIYDAVYEYYDSLININYAKHVISRLESLGYRFY